jgi:hypothetical protein
MLSESRFGKRVFGVTGPKRLLRGTVAVAMVVGIGVPSTVAAADTSRMGSTQVLRYFSKPESMSVTTAAGKPFSPSKSNPPHAGDQFESTDLDYVGSHVKHAGAWTASDHLLCIVMTKGNPICQAQIAIGGSMILLRGVASPSANSNFTVIGGTGQFKGVTGTLTGVTIDPKADTGDSDVTVRLRRP